MHYNDKPLKTIESTFDQLTARARIELRDEATRGARRLHRSNVKGEAWSVIVQAKERGNALLELTPCAIRHTVACKICKIGALEWEVAGIPGVLVQLPDD